MHKYQKFDNDGILFISELVRTNDCKRLPNKNQTNTAIPYQTYLVYSRLNCFGVQLIARRDHAVVVVELSDC